MQRLSIMGSDLFLFQISNFIPATGALVLRLIRQKTITSGSLIQSGLLEAMFFTPMFFSSFKWALTHRLARALFSIALKAISLRGLTFFLTADGVIVRAS